MMKYDEKAASRVLNLVASWQHEWLRPFIAPLSSGYAINGYEWLWNELTVLERQYEPNKV